MANKTTKQTLLQYAILCNERYGIYAGWVEKYDPLTRVALVRECRHVSRWYGRTGGITSLATYGLCGPNVENSRIGAPTVESATLTGIVNVFPCSPEARATLEAAKQS